MSDLLTSTQDYRTVHRTAHALRLEGNVALQFTLLLAITILAVGFRFYKLGEWSFWGDELFTIRDATQAAENLGKASLSNLLTGVSLAAFGVTEWSARLVSALVGIVTIPVLYLPSRKVFGPAVALGSSLILAISPWHLYWSQNARFYTALLLFYSLALFAFYLGMEEDRPGYLVLSLVLMGFAARERSVALLFAPVVLSYLLLVIALPVARPAGFRIRNLALFFVPSILGGLYFVAPYLSDWPGWLESFGRINNNPFWLVAGVVYYVRVPIICMGLFGMVYLVSRGHRFGILLGCSALIPLIGMAVVSLFHYAANRYVFLSLTSWTLLAAVAMVELIRSTPDKARILAIGVLAIMLIDPIGEDILYYKYQNGNRDDWKAAFALVQEQMREGDVVVSSHRLVGDYYLQQDTVDIYGLGLDRIDKLGERIWFVEDMNVPERIPEVHAWLQQSADEVANLDVHANARTFRMRVYLYASPHQQTRTLDGVNTTGDTR